MLHFCNQLIVIIRSLNNPVVMKIMLGYSNVLNVMTFYAKDVTKLMED